MVPFCSGYGRHKSDDGYGSCRVLRLRFNEFLHSVAIDPTHFECNDDTVYYHIHHEDNSLETMHVVFNFWDYVRYTKWHDTVMVIRENDEIVSVREDFIEHLMSLPVQGETENSAKEEDIHDGDA